jgi:hypothetical protein
MVLTPDSQKGRNSCSSKHFHAGVNFSHIHTRFSVVFGKCLAETFSINACNTLYGYRYA